MAERTGRFTRADRVLDSRDYQRISREGQRTAGREFVLLMAPARKGERGRRLGISASRRVGNAVVRNRVKRRIREWFRRGRERLPQDVDLVVIARAPAAELDRVGVEGSLDRLVERALERRSGRGERARH